MITESDIYIFHKEKEMKKASQKKVKTLSLNKETLRMLDEKIFPQALGGMEGSGAQTGCKPPYTCRVN
jgi:hypothetical protein